MTRSRAFNRFHRWTAKVRRRHLKAWLPESREAEPIEPVARTDRHRQAALQDALQELNDPQMLQDSLRMQLEA
jgi:hypothetical protein